MAAVCMGPGPVSLLSLCTPPPVSTPGLHPESALGPSMSPGTQDVDNVFKTPGLSSMAHTTETPAQHALDTQTPKPPPKNREIESMRVGEHRQGATVCPGKARMVSVLETCSNAVPCFQNLKTKNRT